MAANASGHVYPMDSLSFPKGHLDDAKLAAHDIEFGTMDVVLTNPPFGSDIPITDPALLHNFVLAERWEKDKNEPPQRKGYESAVAPEVLFIEQCYRWLKDNGRMGIVLPNGILGNPGDLLQARAVSGPFLERRADHAPRASTLDELIH